MNFRPTKIVIAMASVFALSGCLEVEDGSNDELTAAVLEQNRILNEQSEQQNSEYTVTLAGSIVDFFDGQIINNALVTVRTPTTLIADKVAVTNGNVVIEGGPSNSSIEIVVESTDESFVSWVFYPQTVVTTSSDAVQDLGRFAVSEGEIILTENAANEPSSASNSNRSVYLFFPPELNQLQQFVMRQTSFVSDGFGRSGWRLLRQHVSFSFG